MEHSRISLEWMGIETEGFQENEWFSGATMRQTGLLTTERTSFLGVERSSLFPTPTHMSTTLVVGATGLIGRPLVRELVERHQSVRVLVPETGGEESSSFDFPIEVTVGNPSEPEILDVALTDVDRIVLLSAPAPDEVRRHGLIVEAASRAGRDIHVVLVPVVGALPVAPLQFARWHAVTRAQVRDAGLPLTVVQSQILVQHLCSATASVRADDMICGGFGSVRLPQVDARDVAAATATILTTAGHEGQSYTLTGPQALSYSEIAAMLSVEVGRSIRYVDLPIETYREHLVGNGEAQWRVDDLATLARLVRTRDAWPVTSTVAELTGRSARRARTFLREHAATFRSDALREQRLGAPLPCVNPIGGEMDDELPSLGEGEPVLKRNRLASGS